LRGIVTVAGERVAILEAPGGTVIRARQGETIEGWLVRAINMRSVTLEGDGEQNQIPLFPAVPRS
jgi:hypothetical protein